MMVVIVNKYRNNNIYSALAKIDLKFNNYGNGKSINILYVCKYMYIISFRFFYGEKNQQEMHRHYLWFIQDGICKYNLVFKLKKLLFIS